MNNSGSLNPECPGEIAQNYVWKVNSLNLPTNSVLISFLPFRWQIFIAVRITNVLFVVRRFQGDLATFGVALFRATFPESLSPSPLYNLNQLRRNIASE